MKTRALARVIDKALKTFPAIVVTGPVSQAKPLFCGCSSRKPTVSFEDPDVRIRAKEETFHFLEQYSRPVMIDEIK